VKVRPVFGLVLRQIYLFRGSPVRIIPTVTWVAIDILLWGFITRYLNSVNGNGIDFVPTLLGAVLFWDFCARIMQGVTTAFLEDIWSRNFLNLFASPLSISEYVMGLVVTSVLTSSIGLVVMLVLSSAVFGLQFSVFGLALLGFVSVLFIFGISLGILASAMVLRFGPASEWLVWPLPALLSPFAAVFYPLATLPQWMQWIGRLLPPSYVFEGMRSLLATHHLQSERLLQSALLAIAQLIAAGFVYDHIYRRAVRTGLLARYSAESVG
jgi:ABC-2 type transport system permease protein